MTGALAGQVALITGASRGIGRGVAEAFAREGARLFLVGHVDAAALDETLAAVRALGAEAEGALCDVGDYAAVQRLADRIAERYGTLDILVNNAGTLRPTPLLEIPPAQWDRTVRTHLYGTFYCMQEMTNRFLEPGRAGKIINVTAPSAIRGSHGVADYAAAKGGIIALTRNAAREFLPLNIQVNAVLPVAESRMTDMLTEYGARVLGRTPAPHAERRPTPDEIAPVFVFLASRASDTVTGQILAADGGRTA